MGNPSSPPSCRSSRNKSRRARRPRCVALTAVLQNGKTARRVVAPYQIHKGRKPEGGRPHRAAPTKGEKKKSHPQAAKRPSKVTPLSRLRRQLPRQGGAFLPRWGIICPTARLGPHGTKRRAFRRSRHSGTINHHGAAAERAGKSIPPPPAPLGEPEIWPYWRSRKWGSGGKRSYGHEVPVGRVPRRSFGFFPIAGKETRPAGRNPCETARRVVAPYGVSKNRADGEIPCALKARKRRSLSWSIL